MSEIIELKIKSHNKIYQELVQALFPYREREMGSILFMVEGTKEKPVIGIRYPGRKSKRRYSDDAPANRIKWVNLFDFEVVPFKNGKELSTSDFTYDKILEDFQKNKKDSKEFWQIIEELYENNTITKKIPELLGIEPKLYLLVLKWLWVQEDLNYRLDWEEVKSPVKYRLETKKGRLTSKGAGRARFFAALILVKYYFTSEQVKKIIQHY